MQLNRGYPGSGLLRCPGDVGCSDDAGLGTLTTIREDGYQLERMYYLLKETGKIRLDRLIVDEAPFFLFVNPFLCHTQKRI